MVPGHRSVVSLLGNQVALRDWRAADVAIYARWLRPGHRWHELDAPYEPPPPPDHIPAIVAKRRAAIAAELPRPRTSLVIALRAGDGLVGTVTWRWESAETLWPTVGLAIFDPAHWGRGLGYEALGLWSDYLFRELPRVVRLDLRTWSGNRGMARLAEKLGYREEARFRRARVVDGRYYDGLGYGVLREEWAERYPAGFGAQLRPAAAGG